MFSRKDRVLKAAVDLARLADLKDDPVQFLKGLDDPLALLAFYHLKPKKKGSPACARIPIGPNRPPKPSTKEVALAGGAVVQVSIEPIQRRRRIPQGRPWYEMIKESRTWYEGLLEAEPHLIVKLTPNMGHANVGSEMPHHPGRRFKIQNPPKNTTSGF